MRMLGFGCSIATLVLTFSSAAAAAPARHGEHKKSAHSAKPSHAGTAKLASAHAHGSERSESAAHTRAASSSAKTSKLPQLPPSAPAKDKSAAKTESASGRGAIPLMRADVPLMRAEAPPKVNLKPSCLRPTVTFVRGTEEEAFPLTRCDGSQAPLAVEKLSVLARAGAPKPAQSATQLAKTKGPLLAPGIRRLDPRLIEQLQLVVDHFGKSAAASKQPRVHLVSGFRPSSIGSYHATGHALDVHIEGVANESLVDFCKSLTDVGCGYYPNSSFVHMDVREKGTGHVSWIDASGPGEGARYVEQWPPPRRSSKNALRDPRRGKPKFLESIEDALAKLEKSGAPVVTDEHPAMPSDKAKLSDLPDSEPRDRAAEAPAAALNMPIEDELGEQR